MQILVHILVGYRVYTMLQWILSLFNLFISPWISVNSLSKKNGEAVAATDLKTRYESLNTETAGACLEYDSLNGVSVVQKVTF